MTKLTRPVSREVIVHGVRKPLVVTIDPTEQTIYLREKGRQKVFSLPLYTVLIMAIQEDKKKEK